MTTRRFDFDGSNHFAVVRINTYDLVCDCEGKQCRPIVIKDEIVHAMRKSKGVNMPRVRIKTIMLSSPSSALQNIAE